MTLLETLMAILVLSLLAMTAGGVFSSISREGKINREMTVANAEASHVLSLLGKAPLDDIPKALAADGYVPAGRFVYKKDLAEPPRNLPGGQIEVGLRGVTGTPFPDPLSISVVVTWITPFQGTDSRSYVTVRRRAVGPAPMAGRSQPAGMSRAGASEAPGAAGSRRSILPGRGETP